MGPGQIGLALSHRWYEAGHEIFYTFSRSQEKLQRLASELGERGSWGTPARAGKGCDVLVLSTKWKQVPEAIEQMGNLGGKILLETVNPISEDGNLEIGHVTSAGEQIAQMALGAVTVGAFHSVPATVIGASRDPADLYQGQKPVVFYCGGDERAKRVVAELISAAGFDPCDTGPIDSCRYLEPLALLMIRAASVIQIRDISLGLLRPRR